MKVKITSMKKETKRGEKNKLTFYVSQPRPLDSGNIMADFQWRREHSEPYKAKELLPHLYFIIDMFVRANIREDLKLKYSQYAGCKMCPCSPGYVLSVKDKGYTNYEFWIEVEQ